MEIRFRKISWLDPESNFKGRIRDDETGEEFIFNKGEFRHPMISGQGRAIFGGKPFRDNLPLVLDYEVAYEVPLKGSPRVHRFCRRYRWVEIIKQLNIQEGN